MNSRHRVRSVASLNGLWEFAFLGDLDPDEIDATLLPTDDVLPVPSAFDALPAYVGKRGLALYRTTFEAPAGHPLRLDFEAVSLWCRIAVDGVVLAENGCGYAPFRVAVRPSSETRRVVTVVVDNRFDAVRAPMHEEKFDFYQYGGIVRGVTLHILPKRGAWIEEVRVTPALEQGAVEVAAVLETTGSAKEGFLSIAFDGGKPEHHRWTISDGGTWTARLQVPGARTWSPEEPHLHTLRVAWCEEEDSAVVETDDLEVRFGLRRIEARDGGLWLNGEPLRLKGYNRHEWAMGCGPCTSEVQMVADLQLLRDLGCNFVRGGHYPQDGRFLDLCDAMGFLVWEETLGWQQSVEVMCDPKYRADHAKALLGMVRESYNHPSVIVRGFLNEAESDHPDSRPLFEETVSLLRQVDPSRLITFASDRPGKDLHFDLVDIVSINMYPGWYGCLDAADPLALIAPHMRECFADLDRRGFAGKPIVVSEIGAEGLYGWRDAHRDFFSEEYQALYLAEACRAALSHPRCAGIALWQFSDTRTYGGNRALARPRTFNNKGTLDEHRRPKLAYETVRAAFRKMVEKGQGHVTLPRLEERGLPPVWAGTR